MEYNKKSPDNTTLSTHSETGTGSLKEKTAPNVNGDDTELDKNETTEGERHSVKGNHETVEAELEAMEVEQETTEAEKEVIEKGDSVGKKNEETKETTAEEDVSPPTDAIERGENESLVEPVNTNLEEKENISTENNKSPEEVVKEVSNDVKEKDTSTISDRLENPKEKVPKGRKRKVSETVSTESGRKNETMEEVDTQKESSNEQILDPLVLVKEEPVDMDMYPSSQAEVLGKGKRARIPNKRYSDIMLSPTSNKKSMSYLSENGSLESENDTDTSIKEEPYQSPSYGRSSTPALKRLKVSHTDISDPKYLKPFKYGWKRELVWRGTYDESKGRLGDIYYFTPQGKKVRSRREVAECLSGRELTIDNFTFSKEAIGIDDPSKEVVRDAKVKHSESLSKQVVTKTIKSTPLKTPKSPKLSNSKISSPKLPNQKLASPKLASPRITSPRLASSKIASSKALSPKLASSKVASPKLASPRVTNPRIVSPKIASPKVASPKLTSPKLVNTKTPSSKIANTKVTSPKMANKKITSPKISSPKLTSPKLQRSKLITSPKLGSPRGPLSRLKSTRATSPILNDLAEISTKTRSMKNIKTVVKSPTKKEVKKVPEKPVKKMEVEVPSPKVSVGKRGRRGSVEGDQSEEDSEVGPDKPCQPCSIRCKPGTIPTLQCRVCLCLYHHECVGISPHIALPYICKNCHQEQTSDQSTVLRSATISPTTILGALPPLTPINTLKSAGGQPITLPPPKLQRIPKPSDSETLPPLPSPPKLLKPEQKSLVGSMTTWLPHNAKLIDNIRQVNETPSGKGIHRPQYVEILGGRKFLVIPKHNFMSVSPTVATSAVTSRPDADPINVDSVSLGSEPASDIKTEPDSPSKPENSQTPEAMEVEGIVEDNSNADSAAGDGGTGIAPDIKPEIASPKAPTPPPLPVVKPTKKRTIKLSSITNSEEKEKEENRFMENYLQNISYGYNTLLYVFQYLKVQDLLRAGCVCTMWRDIAAHPILWRTVRMKNSQVHSFEGLANSLRKHGTRHLDLRKMLLPTGGDEIWPEFSKAIEKVDTLRRIELCRCPATVVEKLASSNPRLEVLNAITIKCETMNLEPLKSLTEIKELRLKSTAGLTLTSNIDSLRDMKELRHLSLTSIRQLNEMNLEVIAELSNLESLDLGECINFPASFADILIKLTKLEKLRLEKGQKDCHTFEILDAVRQMERLDQLELVNFDIKAGFDKALGVCQNIKRVLIIPTYISQSATTNHMVLGGVLRLQKTLSHFVWGVTLELLRVTELFVDQCEEPKEKKEKKQVGNGDCIPVLKPVPLLLDKDSEIAPALEPPQVEILALPSLQKLLMQNLPTTRVKILKIPFHATWRQSITDSVS